MRFSHVGLLWKHVLGKRFLRPVLFDSLHSIFMAFNGQSFRFWPSLQLY